MKITKQRGGKPRWSPVRVVAEGDASTGWSSATDSGERISLSVRLPVAGQPGVVEDFTVSMTDEEFDRLAAFVTKCRTRSAEQRHADSLRNDPIGTQQRAIAMLKQLVDQGREFPDASERVRTTYRLSERSMREVVAAYDAL